VTADEFEGVLGRPETDAVAVAHQVECFDLGAFGVGKTDVDEAQRFSLVGARARARSGNTSDGDADGGSGTRANPFRESAGDGFGDRALSFNEVARDVGEDGLECVCIDYSAAEEVARRAGDTGEARGKQATCAARA
jgi:hypothetical protein